MIARAMSLMNVGFAVGLEQFSSVGAAKLPLETVIVLVTFLIIAEFVVVKMNALTVIKI